MHPGGVNFIMCDGSFRTVSLNSDMNLFTNLSTIAGGEVANE
jgi:prepilin-type processing-associated H-X9-DG protein